MTGHAKHCIMKALTLHKVHLRHWTRLMSTQTYSYIVPIPIPVTCAIMPASFRSAVVTIQAQSRLSLNTRRYSHTIEDPNDPYSNHSESEPEDDEDVTAISRTPSGTDIQSAVSSTTISSSSIESGEKLTKNKLPKLRRYRGMLLALLSSLIFSLSALLVKKLEGYHPFSLALWRFQGAFLPVLPLIIYTSNFRVGGRNKLENRIWPWNKSKNVGMLGLVVLRSVLSCNSLLLHFYSLKYLSMGDALTIASSTPIFVALLAKLFLNEKCGLITILASLLTLIGVVAITRPPLLTGASGFDNETLIGSALALGCMFLASISFTVLRYIRKVHYSITTLLFGVWGSLENVILALVFDVLKIPVGVEEWCLIGGLAVLTFLGQCAIILAMKAEQAGPVALVRTCDVIFAFLWQIVILKLMPDKISVIGAVIVVFAVGLCGFRKWLRGLPVGHPTRARFRYFMM